MKPLCIVDTCSLIYLSDIELARKRLHLWLSDEFEVGYSRFVWEHEIQAHLDQMGGDGRRLRRGGTGNVWPIDSADGYERALFASFSRIEQVGLCRTCGRPTLGERAVEIDLGSDEDRGERHNCSVALAAVRAGRHRNVIFLTDDYNAVWRYVAPVFATFPLGSVWSSYDFALYLFVRHRARITQDEVKIVFQDLTAKALRGNPNLTPAVQELWTRRVGAYCRKVERVNQVISRLP